MRMAVGLALLSIRAGKGKHPQTAPDVDTTAHLCLSPRAGNVLVEASGFNRTPAPVTRHWPPKEGWQALMTIVAPEPFITGTVRCRECEEHPVTQAIAKAARVSTAPATRK